MRILHVISSLDPKGGGVSQALKTMIKGLKELGITNAIASLDLPTSKFYVDQSDAVFQAGPAKSPWKYSIRLHRWLKKELFKYDGVIVHGIWHYHSFAVYTIWKSLVTKPRFYIMPHGMLDPYFQQSQDRKFKSLRNSLFWTLIEKRLINNADGLLFTCDQERLLANRTFKSYRPKREFVVGLGVEDPPAFSLSMRKAFFEICPKIINEDYLLFLGRIDKKKGLDLLFSAYEKLGFRSPPPRSNSNKRLTQKPLPKLVIAGPNLESEYGESLRKWLLERPDVMENVHFVGMLTGDAKWGAFYDCQAFVLPSHQENFGISIVEALACYKPVLISDQVNIWREISNGNAGFIELDTEDGTKTLIERWLNLSDDKRSEMQYNARALYDSNFNTKKASQRLVSVMTQ